MLQIYNIPGKVTSAHTEGMLHSCKSKQASRWGPHLIRAFQSFLTWRLATRLLSEKHCATQVKNAFSGFAGPAFLPCIFFLTRDSNFINEKEQKAEERLQTFNSIFMCLPKWARHTICRWQTKRLLLNVIILPSAGKCIHSTEHLQASMNASRDTIRDTWCYSTGIPLWQTAVESFT